MSILNRKNSLISLIEIALINWVKSRCKSTKDLKLSLETQVSEILKGNIPKVNLDGSCINFKNIFIDRVSVEASNIKLKLTISKRIPKIIIINSFKTNLKLSFTEEGINKMINSNELSWIGSWFINNFFSTGEFEKLEVKENLVEIVSRNISTAETEKKCFIFNIINGRFTIKEDDKNRQITFPIEESIYFKEVFVNQCVVNFNCTSEVIP